MSDNPGIDYGFGKVNRDPDTGIRFGVISINALNEWAWESFESYYGDPTCPECGNQVKDSSDYDGCEDADLDYYCEVCRKSFWSNWCYADEPLGHELDDGKYKATMSGDDNDIFLLKSPYYTHAQFCSPCAPGAGHLENPCDAGPKTYCFDPSWFSKDRPCPYKVYRVDNNECIYIPVKETEGDA